MGTLLSEGVWVKIILDSHYLNGVVGYITSVYPDDKEYTVRIVKNREGKALNKDIARLCDFDVVIPVPIELQEDDLAAMVDLAIDSNDKEWFQELTSKLPKELPW